MDRGGDAVLPVVVVHFRAPDWCRSSVAAMLASDAVRVDVTVVDNSGDLAGGGVPGAARVVASGANAGYAGGANLGVRTALQEHPGATHVAVCSHDFHPDPDCFARLLDAARRDGSLGIVAPRLTDPKPSIGAWFDGRRSTNVEPHDDAPPVFEADWVSGTCMVVRTDALRVTGGFDEGFGSYVEDVDLCLRVREAGWRVATVTAAAGHGLGSVSSVRFRLTATNVALLAAKREGVWPARRLVARYALRSIRSGLLAVLPSTRGLGRRRASLRYAAAQGGAAWHLLRSGMIGRYAADPGHAQPEVVGS